jgi:uncharacterized Zn-binding protein involved in type VI secretion
MPGIARTGDTYGPGGIITTEFSKNVFVNGRPVALNNIQYTPHPCCKKPKCPPSHCGGKVPGKQAEGFRVKINGVYPVLKGDLGTCGHGVRTASKNVRIGTGSSPEENPETAPDTGDELLNA